MFIQKLKNRSKRLISLFFAQGEKTDPSSANEFKEICDTIKNYKIDADVLLDIGAYKGLFCNTANSYFDFKKTICFEPNLKLHKEIKDNNPKINLTVEKTALDTKDGTADYYMHQDSSMNSLIESNNEVLKNEFPWDNPDFLKKINLTTTTLDVYIRDNNLSQYSFFIKIDTQGNELNILRESTATLEKTQGLLVEFMFTTPYNTDFSFYDLIDFLDKQGFKCEGALSIRKRPSKKISAVDFLFVRETKL